LGPEKTEAVAKSICGFFVLRNGQKGAQFLKQFFYSLKAKFNVHLFNVSHSKRQAQVFFLNKNVLLKKSKNHSMA
jgi:hypothetical protein